MRTYLSLLFLICCTQGFAQSSERFAFRTIVFYNVENLFDTTNDSLVWDDDRTPEGRYHWTQNRYETKLDHISKVLRSFKTPKGSPVIPDVIGICEVENRKVVEELVAHPELQRLVDDIIHYDSPDKRGIDVALLCREESFTPTSFQSRRLLLFEDDCTRQYTRDQLVVGGYLDGELFYFIVNHWPSRRGGAVISNPKRIRAALLNKRITDSLLTLEPKAKIVGMGDFNDDPFDTSLKKTLKTGNLKRPDSLHQLYNPMDALYKKGVGSLAHWDSWHLFDQFYITQNLISESKETLSFWKAGVWKPKFLITRKGRYKGYPFRTYAGGRYAGGYSDHFPIYMYLLKKVSN